MHISIAGRLGSGKSTIANILKDEHGFEIYSTGAIHREIASQHEVSTLEMNQLMAKDTSFDNAIDDAVTRISIERCDETIIFDSRMAWKFAANSFKVFVTVDPLEAASRVMSRRGGVEEYTSLEDAKTKLIERGRLENERFVDIYGVNNFCYSNYNLVIDSTFATADELAGIIYNKFLEYCESGDNTGDDAGNGALEVLLSPFSLYPLVDVSVIEAEKIASYRERREYLSRFVSFIVFEGYHYIVDGHKRVLAAILNKESFINVVPVDEEFIVSKIRDVGTAGLEAFEETGKFKYRSYPDFYN